MSEEKQIDDGGPAFPVVEVHPVHGSRIDLGMSLRDYFAGQALNSLLMSGHNYLQVADHAFKVADAMLKARKQ